MWVIAKLFAAFVGLIIRVMSRYSRPWFRGYKEHGSGEQTWFIKFFKSKNRILSTTVAVRITAGHVFKLTQESHWDRIFKYLGVSKEIQSGDRNFDERVYIACDSPAFESRVSKEASVRQAILELFNTGAKQIVSDGSLLWAHFDGDQTSNPQPRNQLFRLAEGLSKAQEIPYRLIQDRFAVRALFAEALVWFLAGYALMGGFEWLVDKQDTHLDPYPIVRLGLAIGFLGAAIALSFVVIFMRGSSRGHRIILESAIVLALCLPLGGMHLASDINRNLDDGTTEVVNVEIFDRVRQVHRGRRGRKSYSYHLYLRQSVPLSTMDAAVPMHIRVSSGLFDLAEPGRKLRVEVAPGFLNIPWYRSLLVGN